MQNVNTESSLDSTNQSKVESNIQEPHNAISVESKLADSPVAISPIANLPIALFASVMGIGGLSLVLKKQVWLLGAWHLQMRPLIAQHFIAEQTH